MIINPVKMGTNLSGVRVSDIQQNGIDLRLEEVFRIEESTFILSEDKKIHRQVIKMQHDDKDWFDLYPGSYQVIVENKIKIPKNESGIVITRSTLNRNGVFITSGWYDSGYSGHMSLAMHINIGNMKIQKGTRIAQYISFESDSSSLYTGSYGKSLEQDLNIKG